MIMKFDQDNFDKEVLKSDIPVMVDFFAEWCGPCKMMGPVVEELEEEYKGKIKIGQLNVDDNPEIAERYSVMSIPNFIFFKNGQPVAQSIGGVPKATLEEKIKEVL
ncbi:MAG: thioredoxin [Lachnospiraceae bacterium]|nr:thioredoxin [Lachnospiraceae bacterium]MCH4028923.1 thioredoxin [Lachnospiraceae bacterium]MCH4066777.1 thioredoxin [Lachnospiraceae bacterium]MCH4112804.1 thioredoxin [Lachnospiraceae bacterium]MCI1353184.1 thioredoxin [Lachnospiraceae bacterium]